MAYEGGGLLRIWNPDLSDRIGAESAMDSAKFGFLLIAGFRAVTYGIAAVTVGISLNGVSPTGLPVALLAGLALLEIAVPLFAAWRLHLYRGAFVVPIATLLYALSVLLAPTPTGIVIGIIFTGVFVSGIRGAWALRSMPEALPSDVAHAFE